MQPFIFPLFYFLLPVLAVQTLGGIATYQSVDEWYPQLIKPSFTPPDWVFGPVWSVLYLLMALSAWRVWARLKHQGMDAGSHPALRWWGAQLVLNLDWSLIFFGLRAPLLAAVELGGLIAAVIVTMVYFARIRPLACAMLVPYLLWLCFAFALNVEIARLNPTPG